MFARYRDSVLFVVLYQREAHAGELTFEDIEQPETYEERTELASRCQTELGLTRTIVVDEMDNAVREVYGGLPNSAYIIAKGGEIVHKEGWARPSEWPAILDDLLSGTQR